MNRLAFAFLLILPAAAFAGGKPDFCYEYSPAQPAADILGHNEAEIHARFPGVIEHNFAVNSRVLNALSPKELADLTNTYRAAGGTKLKAALEDRLAKLTRVGAASGPAPTIYMTLEEIYLEFRTAPIGALGVEAALYETFMFSGIHIYAAAKFGWDLGTEIGKLIKEYDPALDAALDQYIAAEVQAFMDADSLEDYASIETTSDYEFATPVPTRDNPGDYDVVWDMYIWGFIGGGC